MALLKSAGLIASEIALSLEIEMAENAEKLMRGWSRKQPVMTPTELPAVKIIEDNKPFGYDYSHLPSRSSRHGRWSQI